MGEKAANGGGKKTLRKPGELLLKTILKSCCLEAKYKESVLHFNLTCYRFESLC